MNAEELLERYAEGARDFTGVNLDHVHLNNAKLANINLSRASLRRAKLEGADLSFANLRETDFHFSKLSRVILEDIWKYGGVQNGQANLRNIRRIIAM